MSKTANYLSLTKRLFINETCTENDEGEITNFSPTPRGDSADAKKKIGDEKIFRIGNYTIFSDR